MINLWLTGFCAIKASLRKHAYCLVKSENTECVKACEPRRARPEALIAGVALLEKGRAIPSEVRLAAERFRSRRDVS